MGSVDTLQAPTPHIAYGRREKWPSLERRLLPDVSVVVPVKNSQRTIRATVVALLTQDYPALAEVIVVGDVGDQTWQALADIDDPRLVMIEHEEVADKREPATKRDVGLRKARGQILALADSDIRMDRGWLSRGVTLIADQRGGVVCGGMRAANNSFWSRFVDGNTLAAKTPRVPRSYRVTPRNFGRHGRKPPIAANVIMERGVYADCPMDDNWGYGYEDYEWFWRLAKSGHKILYAAGLEGAHHHRQSFRALAWEYLVSANGCATFIRAYPDSPLARKRHRQAVLLPLLATAAGAGAAAAVTSGYAVFLLVAASAAAIWILSREVALAGRLEAMAYVLPALLLGSLFVFSLGWRLVRSARLTVRRRSWAWPRQRLAREFPAAAALPRLPEFDVARRVSWEVAGLSATDGRSAPSSGASGARGQPVDKMQRLEESAQPANALGRTDQPASTGASTRLGGQGRPHGRHPLAQLTAPAAFTGTDNPPWSDAPGSASVSPVLVEPDQAFAYPAVTRRPASGHGPGGGGWRHSHRLGLLVVLAVQAALALRLLWSNTAFQDEAQYLWYGHLEWQHWLHGTPLPASNFSGAPQVYPPLGALADSVGGLAGARLLSLLFMLGATALLYASASRIFGKNAGLIAAAMFVAVGPTADMGAWATYDPMAIFLSALSAWLAVRAARGRVAELWVFLAAAVMVLADATKWVTALWNPVIVALVVLTAPANWPLALARGVRLVCYAVAMAAPALFVFRRAQYLTQISATTTNRGTGGTPEWWVLWTAAPMIAAILVLALVGLLLSWREHGDRRTVLCAAFVVAVLLAPLFQARDETTVSLYKHVVFGVWFGAMGAGYALSKGSVINAAKGWRVGLAAAVFTGLVGFDQASFWYGLWPNSKPLVAAVERLLPARGPVLMQDGDSAVALYYLRPLGLQPDVNSSYAYSPAAISSMIASHQVWMVETDVGTGTPLGSMQLSVAGSPAAMERAGYRPVARIRWRDPDHAVGWFTIWLLERGRVGG